MVLNELVTNASKHGALSNDAGQVRLKWRQHTDHAGVDMVDISGGKATVRSWSRLEAAGFGTALIERSVQYELEGGSRSALSGRRAHLLHQLSALASFGHARVQRLVDASGQRLWRPWFCDEGQVGELERISGSSA